MPRAKKNFTAKIQSRRGLVIALVLVAFLSIFFLPFKIPVNVPAFESADEKPINYGQLETLKLEADRLGLSENYKEYKRYEENQRYNWLYRRYYGAELAIYYAGKGDIANAEEKAEDSFNNAGWKKNDMGRFEKHTEYGEIWGYVRTEADSDYKNLRKPAGYDYIVILSMNYLE